MRLPAQQGLAGVCDDEEWPEQKSLSAQDADRFGRTWIRWDILGSRLPSLSALGRCARQWSTCSR
jgi:hypothetical protein